MVALVRWGPYCAATFFTYSYWRRVRRPLDGGRVVRARNALWHTSQPQEQSLLRTNSAARKDVMRELGSGLPARARVLIIGGGILGLWIARTLNAYGFTRVLVVEGRKVGCGGTADALGIIRTQHHDPRWQRLTVSAALDYSRLMKTPLGQSPVMTIRQGSGEGKGTNAPYRMDSGEGAASGMAFRMDPRFAATALFDTLRDSGVEFLERVAVNSLKVQEGKVTSVSSEAGDLPCDICIVATGPSPSPDLLELPVARTRVPVVTVHQARSPRNYRGTLPLLLDYSQPGGLYLAPDETGWVISLPPTNARSVSAIQADNHEVLAMLQKKVERRIGTSIPTLDEKQMYWGTYDTTVDGLPFIGRVAELSNCFTAVGFGGSGFQAAPGAARVLLETVIQGGNTSKLARPFDPTRFTISKGVCRGARG
jgi:sarcosine oxidase subunit beta